MGQSTRSLLCVTGDLALWLYALVGQHPGDMSGGLVGTVALEHSGNRPGQDRQVNQ